MSLPEHYLGNGVTIDLRYLADDLADDLTDDQLIEFIMAMDARKADAHFTNRLIIDLHNSLSEELS